MKNLSAILRLSLPGTFTILITFVVCLAHLTEAEVYQNYKNQYSNLQDQSQLKENSIKKTFPYNQRTSNMRSNELKQSDFGNIQNFHEPSLDKLLKRHSDYLEESDEFDNEKESDGYGYDDDEYYHFNFKRNEGSIAADSKEGVNEVNQKKAFVNQKQFKNQNEKDKEVETIELLNFKESHPVVNSNDPQNSMQSSKSFTNEMTQKKTASENSNMDSLNLIDLKENSAIDENLKERKDESGAVLSSGTSESKVAESKKSKTNEDKDTAKLKDSKMNEETEKKDKESSLKDAKESVASKNLKDTSKNSEEKEKGVKLSESAKLEENVEKISGKNKDNDASYEDKDLSKLSGKEGTDAINSNEISQINNRVSFVSNDYKDSFDASKTAEVEGDEKTTEEINENDKHISLSDYQKVGENKEKQYNLRKTEKSGNYGYMNGQYNFAEGVLQVDKPRSYLTLPLSMEYHSNYPSDIYKKRESWKGYGKSTDQSQGQQDQQADRQQQLAQEEMCRQQPQLDLSVDQHSKNNFPLNFPASELANTEYHKNYIKSLKRYKGDSTKIFTPERSNYNSIGKINFREQPETQKKKRSKSKKRRSMLLNNEDVEAQRLNMKGNAFQGVESPFQGSMLQPQEFLLNMLMSKSKGGTNADNEEESSNRMRRKSPQKLEYEIKVINQNQHDSKNVQFSQFYPSNRMKKEAKTKLSTEDKYLKKYPYSQVSRDDLTRISEVENMESEKIIKRKAPVWKRQERKSAIRTRAAPSGYYSNRVKFGQKNFSKNNEKVNADSSNEESRISSQYLNGLQSMPDKSDVQRVWEMKQQNYKHEPMKRFDETAYLNKENSLLLVKKGEKIAKAFEEGNNGGNIQSVMQDDLSKDQLAQILSKDNDYVVLKRTENNNFKKIADNEPTFFSESSNSYKKSNINDQATTDSLKSNGKQTFFKTKSLHPRASHSEKEDKKYSASFHSTSPKSNLKKTLDKFRDLADFFKDSEQESQENQYPVQEVKEGRDIVFSEDKMPDPIIITSDGSIKNEALKPKPLNSIYSISTNFKNLDQPDRKVDLPTNSEPNKNYFTSGVKSDSEQSWGPALKSVFPEAKSINTINKNGNEIIVLDFNRNQLSTDFSIRPPLKSSSSKNQNLGTISSSSHVPANNPLGFAGERKVQVILNDVSPSQQTNSGIDPNKYQDRRTNTQNGPYAIMNGAQPQISLPFQELADLPNLFKNLIAKKTNDVNMKTVTKKSTNENPQNKMSQSYNQLNDLSEYSNLNKKSKSDAKRNAVMVTLPTSSISELSSYTDVSIKHLGNLLQNIMAKENFASNDFKDSTIDSISKGLSKNADDYPKSEQSYSNALRYEPDTNLKRQGQWLSVDEKGGDLTFMRKNSENIPNEVKEEISNLFQSRERSKTENKKYEDELWNELAAISDKVYRLRREGTGKRKLRKTIEDALSFKDNSNLTPDLDEETTNFKISSNSIAPNLRGDASLVDDTNIEESNFYSQLKSDKNAKEDDKKSLEANYKSYFSQFFENLDENKNQKNPIDSTWIRQKRKDSHRRKRFSKRDVKNKVSKTEVENTILKNLAEDNYSGVYFPGIKRKVVSTNIDAEDADNYTDADVQNNKETGEEPQPKDVKNAANIDPFLFELFHEDDMKGGKNRARRSSSSFHSNLKREIDLDESMPNDFQNFLVTSLGGFGSQEREIVKRDESFWEGKENPQDNQNADSAFVGKDSPLEKREASFSERQHESNHRNAYYLSNDNADSNLVNVMSSLKHSGKRVRSSDQAKVKQTKTEFAEEKSPTQIRIQITKAASSKEKKSSKPINDESETTSTDMENLPKEKEFFDKNKLNPLFANNHPKLHQIPKNKYSFSEFEEEDHRDLEMRPKQFWPYRRGKRKRKKYVPESPMKPITDFIAFDQKAMETLLRRCNANQNVMSDQTTQKSPVSNHLPQVETVYNPTQGATKAQLETSRFGKMSAANNKNSINVKSNLRQNEPSSIEDGVLGSFLKTNKKKSDKELKDLEDTEWKPYSTSLRQRPDSMRDSHYGFNNALRTLNNVPAGESDINKHDLSHYLSSVKTNALPQKWLQSPCSSYFYHPPSTAVINTHSLYDALKLRQEMKNRNAFHKPDLTEKNLQKPYYLGESNSYKADEKDKAPASMNPYSGENYLNTLGYSLNKKPFNQADKCYSTGTKTPNKGDTRYKNTLSVGRKFLKNLEDDKSTALDSTVTTASDNIKDTDYLDTLEEEYPDEDAVKESQSDDFAIRDALKKNKFHDSSGYHRLYNYKNSDVDDSMNEDDEEFDEDYEENSEDDDLDDYSLLASTKALDPDIPKTSHSNEKLQEAYHPDDGSHFNYFYPQLKGTSFEQTKFNSQPEEKFSRGMVDIKSDPDPISESSSILKKVNENSNIFGKNLMKNLNGYNYEDSLNRMDKLQSERTTGTTGNKLIKRKFDGNEKLNFEIPTIGSRLFYAAKTEVDADRDLNPLGHQNIYRTGRSRNKRNTYDTAELVSFENEIQHGKHFKDNITNSQENYNNENLRDVVENLEGNSESNVLENVTGRYIMKKQIISSDKISNLTEKSFQNSIGHKIKRRSTIFVQTDPKTLSKRLSSGHLTENNFRKYHKKKLNKKRHINELVYSYYGKNDEYKRSALDLFKKITNKDRDSKKAEAADSRSAGFEPLTAVNEKKYGGTLKETKNGFLIQEKKLTSDNIQSDGALPELKAHYPNEHQHLKEELTERKKEKTKEAVKENPPQLISGPLKIELNNKYGLRFNEAPEEGNEKILKEQAQPEKEDEKDNLKAYLVISANVKATKRNSNVLPSGSKLYLRETANKYGASHVRKRSAISATFMEDTSKLTKNSNPENNMEAKKNNLNSLNKESFYVGDSKPQSLETLHRNMEKSSYVSTDDKSRNSQCPSNGRLINRKSVYPPSSDANINRDCNQTNEGSSEYLGQRIVDAILTRVSENPKFKNFIAPGLSMKTLANKEAIYHKRTALHENDFSEQLQSFLQKFMFDLEKLAQKHVEKRMCSKIDKKSKEFLESLLSTATANNSETNCDSTEKFSTPDPETQDPVTPSFMKSPEAKANHRKNLEKEDTLASLKKKQNLLYKLIKDYKNLSAEEKENLNLNYREHLHDLHQNNQDLETSNNHLFMVPHNLDENEKKTNLSQNTENFKGKLLMIPCSLRKNFIKLKQDEHQSEQSTESSNISETSTNLSPFPVYCFEELTTKEDYKFSTTPRSTFEKVKTADPAELCLQKNSGIQNMTQNATDSSNRKNSQSLVSTAQSFDLLHCQNIGNETNEPNSSPESANIKRSELKDDSKHKTSEKKSIDEIRYENSTEPHKLSLGDAVGLQLSLKYRHPRVSNLNISRSVPELADAFSVQTSKNKQQLTEISPAKKLKNRKARDSEPLYVFSKPVFSFSVDKKFFAPKLRPFGTVNQYRFPSKSCLNTIQFLSKKGSAPEKKKNFWRSNPCLPSANYQRHLLSKSKIRKTNKRMIHYFLMRHPKKTKTKPTKRKTINGATTKTKTKNIHRGYQRLLYDES